jgi:hypothetical protein
MGDIFIQLPQAAERLAEALKRLVGVVGPGYPAGRDFLTLMLVRWSPLVNPNGLIAESWQGCSYVLAEFGQAKVERPQAGELRWREDKRIPSRRC